MAFLELFIRPEESRIRVSEEIAIEGKRLNRRGVITYRLPEGAGQGPIILPVLRFKKGELVDVLQVTDESGRTLSALPNPEFSVLLAHCIRVLIQVIASDPSERTRLEGLFLPHALRAIDHAQYAQVRDFLRTEVADLSRQFDYPTEVLVELTCHAAMEYGVCVVLPAASVPDSTHRTITYSYSEQPIDGATAKRERTQMTTYQKLARVAGYHGVEAFKDRLRLILGLQVSWMAIDASRARRCLSYHLRVKAPAGAIVGDAAFLNCENGEPIERARMTGVYIDERSDFRLPRPRGQSYVHLHTRLYKHSGVQEPNLLLRFLEDFPGGIARAGMLSLGTAVVVWLLAVIYSASKLGDAPSSYGDNAELAALVLTIPIAIWSASGFADGPRGYLTSLAAHAVTVASMLLSLFALVLFLLPAGSIPQPEDFPESVLLIKDKVWMVLFFLAGFNCLIGIRLWLTRGLWHQRNSRATSRTSRTLPRVALPVHHESQSGDASSGSGTTMRYGLGSTSTEAG